MKGIEAGPGTMDILCENSNGRDMAGDNGIWMVAGWEPDEVERREDRVMGVSDG